MRAKLGDANFETAAVDLSVTVAPPGAAWGALLPEKPKSPADCPGGTSTRRDIRMYVHTYITYSYVNSQRSLLAMEAQRQNLRRRPWVKQNMRQARYIRVSR